MKRSFNKTAIYKLTVFSYRGDFKSKTLYWEILKHVILTYSNSMLPWLHAHRALSMHLIGS